MIHFRDFLTEETSGEWHEYDGGGSGTHRVSHRAQIGPHAVNILFHGEKRGQYQADFTVDHKVRALSNDNPHAVRILRHVQRKTDEFIRKHKPRSLIMMGSSDKHDKVYKYHREQLARKYHGRTDHDNDEVFFNHRKAQEAGVQY